MKVSAIVIMIVVIVMRASGAAGAAEPNPLQFTLTKPSGTGPFAAVVILHDCSGLGPRSSGAPWRWSTQLTAWGYVTIWPDSFAPRGKPGGVCIDATPPFVPPRLRVEDALAALDHLQSLGFVDGRRIAVMGGSHGGSSTLAAIVETPAAKSRQAPGFAAAVALYPSCGVSYGNWQVTRSADQVLDYKGDYKPTAPLLILTGELDDWTPAEPCRKLVDSAKGIGAPAEIKVYPGAHHAFDSGAPIRFGPDRINRNAKSGRGATTGGNPAAWADAIVQVRGFLERHLTVRPGVGP